MKAILRYSQILPDTPRYSQILPDSAQILPDTPRDPQNVTEMSLREILVAFARLRQGASPSPLKMCQNRHLPEKGCLGTATQRSKMQ